MKRLLRNLGLMLCALGLALALDRLGAFTALAARLEEGPSPTPEVSLSWEAESAPWRAPSPGKAAPPEEEDAEAFLPAAIGPEDLRLDGRREVDVAALLREGWSCRLPREGPQVLILHTHACEAYTPQGDDQYEPSGDYRTLDEGHSVIAVGDELCKILEAAGYGVLHDRTLYDYPAYNGAYDRSGEAVRDLLEDNPTIRVVIDLHRDALGGVKTRYTAPDGAESAQVMLLLTTGDRGLYHPAWRENLKLGLEVYDEMERTYRGLARPLYLSPARYNQHLCPGSFLAEVGTEANTLAEAKEAAALLGNCLVSVLDRHRER